jgi:hypothetical protein
MSFDAEARAAYEAAQNAALDDGRAVLVLDAVAWTAQMDRLVEMVRGAERAGERRYLPMELAGSWQLGQITASRWLAVLKIESEQRDAAEAEQRHARAVASRRPGSTGPPSSAAPTSSPRCPRWR